MKKALIIFIWLILAIVIANIIHGTLLHIIISIAGLFLAIVWFIVIFLIATYFAIKTFNKSHFKSQRFQKIYRFLLKSIVPLFIFLFIAGDGTTLFINPHSYWCTLQQLFYRKYYEYNLYGIFIEGNEGSGIKINFKHIKNEGLLK